MRSLNGLKSANCQPGWCHKKESVACPAYPSIQSMNCHWHWRTVCTLFGVSPFERCECASKLKMRASKNEQTLIYTSTTRPRASPIPSPSPAAKIRSILFGLVRVLQFFTAQQIEFPPCRQHVPLHTIAHMPATLTHA